MITLKRLHATVREHTLKPRHQIVSNSGAHSRSRYLQVAVEDGDGHIGYGEAATTLNWSGEWADAAKVLLNEWVAKQLKNLCLDHPSEIAQVLDGLAYGNAFLKSAIDCAVWDLYAHRLGRSVASLVCSEVPRRHLQTRASIGMYPVEETVAAARYFWEAGVRILKFKTGLPGSLDNDRLKAVRLELGDAPRFTIDYNGYFTNVQDALTSIRKLARFGIDYAEQPTHRDALALMAEVRRESPVPIIGDEAVFTPAHLEEAIRLQACDVVCLYPGKNGGFSQSLVMAERCRQAGLQCVGGSNLETDLGAAATIALSASAQAFNNVPGDFAQSLYYENSSCTQAIILEKGEILLPQSPGFGVIPL